jgi:hypothetical protein
VKPGTDSFDPIESPELEWPQPTGPKTIPKTSATNGMVQRSFFIGFLPFQNPAPPSGRLSGT